MPAERDVDRSHEYEKSPPPPALSVTSGTRLLVRFKRGLADSHVSYMVSLNPINVYRDHYHAISVLLTMITAYIICLQCVVRRLLGFLHLVGQCRLAGQLSHVTTKRI